MTFLILKFVRSKVNTLKPMVFHQTVDLPLEISVCGMKEQNICLRRFDLIMVLLTTVKNIRVGCREGSAIRASASVLEILLSG